MVGKRAHRGAGTRPFERVVQPRNSRASAGCEQVPRIELKASNFAGPP